MFLSFRTFSQQQHYKNRNREKSEKFTWNKFSKVFIQIPGTSRSHWHIIKSGFGVDVTRLFLYREITRNISCREKLFNQKICAQLFRTNSICFLHYLLFYFRLNKTGKKVFSKLTKIYR